MTKVSREAGKGDAPRKQQDQEKYCHNWEIIFGKKDDERKPDQKQSDRIGLQDRPDST